jgi:hypothetical protein
MSGSANMFVHDSNLLQREVTAVFLGLLACEEAILIAE